VNSTPASAWQGTKVLDVGMKGRAVVYNQITLLISYLLKDSHSLYSLNDLYNLLKKLKDDFTPSLEELEISALI
jgi:hypothetical protein